MQQFTRALQRKCRYFYLRLLRLRGTPREIARGLAVGVFWGMFPLPGLQTIVAVLTAAVVRGSKLAAAAGTWLSNPLTTLPFTVLNFKTGQWILGRHDQEFPLASLRSISGFLQLGTDVVVSYLCGCCVTGLSLGVLTYGLAIPIVGAVQRRSQRRRHRSLTRRSDSEHL